MQWLHQMFTMILLLAGREAISVGQSANIMLRQKLSGKGEFVEKVESFDKDAYNEGESSDGQYWYEFNQE